MAKWHGVISECTYIFIDGEDESEQSFNSFQFATLFQKEQKIFSGRNRPGCFGRYGAILYSRCGLGSHHDFPGECQWVFLT